jgi:hypothetical protein
MWAALFVLIGLTYQLQLFADGAMFSYSVAVQDVWAFHWHNISGRLFVYLIAEAPAELYVALTGDPQGGIGVYGLLFFSAPLAGLIGTWAADRSPGRLLFAYACASTACLCPLVFGFPTEMWVAHALFWPTLAVCHYAKATVARAGLVFVLLLALMFTHGAGVLLAAVVLLTLALGGARDPAYLRAAAACALAISIWLAVKFALPPDAYDGPMMRRAALHFLDLAIFTRYVVILLFCAIAAYAAAFLALQRFSPAKAHVYAALLVAVALAAYWWWFDGLLHGDDRYPMRTVLFIATAALGMIAAVHARTAEGRLNLSRFPWRPMAGVAGESAARAILGAVIIVSLVHAVETARFLRVWTDYKAAVRALTMGTVADAALGDARFVSSSRISPDLNRLSWFSTTQFFSVLVAPGLTPPARLVVDPTANYFWLSCQTARANETAERAMPQETRRLIRVHACLHR